MLKWTHKHTINTIIACGGSPCLDLILGSLLSSNMLEDTPAPLQQAYLWRVQPETVPMLGSFSALQKLELYIYSDSFDAEPPAELQTLRGLPRLTDLVLHDGRFLGLESLSYLTSLSVVSAFVRCESECAFLPSLQQLIVIETSLAIFHAKGLSACSGLQSLHLASASLKTVNKVDLLAFCHYEKAIVSHSSSALGAITALSIEYLEILESNMPLGWLSHLTFLQHLKLAVILPQFKLSEDISRLKRLTKLEVISGKSRGHFHWQVTFNFRWTELVALQHLFLVLGSARFCQGLLDLTQMKALKYVKFKCLEGSDERMKQQIGKLAYELGVTRPDVSFVYCEGE